MQDRCGGVRWCGKIRREGGPAPHIEVWRPHMEVPVVGVQRFCKSRFWKQLHLKMRTRVAAFRPAVALGAVLIAF
ncbi:uncharacterized protein HKW66_Vig0117470 [Vigna angularis]|uniref:Uncharacterized protein n=1 Tax=Phaseolus angularis TaxID=3914 RepID=A0A8T0JVM3_PHAAN|nr:uncharacterized protein HKW66_Vig0117470 [Vigna angularis]